MLYVLAVTVKIMRKLKLSLKNRDIFRATASRYNMTKYLNFNHKLTPYKSKHAFDFLQTVEKSKIGQNPAALKQL